MKPLRKQVEFDEDLALLTTDDGSITVFDRRVGESFHSESGALSESKRVFLENSGLLDRLQKNQTASILEVGFGTGLNFLFTADEVWESGGELDYVGVDTRIPSIKLMEQLAHSRWLRNPGLLDDLCRGLAQPVSNPVVVGFGTRIRLELHCQDAVDFTVERKFDVVYLDAFSPTGTPKLWTEDYFRKLYQVLSDDGVIVTYCVKSEVQRRFRQVGFRVEKLPGPPGGKREVLRANK